MSGLLSLITMETVAGSHRQRYVSRRLIVFYKRLQFIYSIGKWSVDHLKSWQKGFTLQSVVHVTGFQVRVFWKDRFIFSVSFRLVLFLQNMYTYK